MLVALALLLPAACGGTSQPPAPGRPSLPRTTAISTPAGIHKIQHVVVIMQENRSFDSYFGTYPGADGIPGLAGNPGKVPCVPDPRRSGCDKPYHDPKLVNGGGSHNAPAALADINNGRMNGFVANSEKGRGRGCGGFAGVCKTSSPSDVMGYHDAREIPNYWTYAKHFVLDDHMFESDASWSLPAHLYMVSEWSAHCSIKGDPKSCVNDDEQGGFKTAQIAAAGGRRARGSYRRCLRSHLKRIARNGGLGSLRPARRDAVRQCANIRARKKARLNRLTVGNHNYAWTDLTYLLHKHHVSWGYFVTAGGEPDCPNGASNCNSGQISAGTPRTSGTRCRPLPTSSKTISWVTFSPRSAFSPTRARAHCRRSPGLHRTRLTPITHRPTFTPARPTSPT